MKRQLRLFPALLLLLLSAACGQEKSPGELLAQAKDSISKGDDGAATIALKNALLQDGNLGEGHYLLGTLHNRHGQFASGEKELRRARDTGYNRDQATLELAESLLGQEQYQRVLDEITAGDDTPDEIKTRILSTRGNALLGLGQREQAERLFEELLQADPNAVAPRLGKARIAARDGKFDTALAEVDLALKHAPKDRLAWHMKAETLQQLGQVEPALAAYREAVRIDPKNILARVGIATLLLEGGNVDAAGKEVDAALRLDTKPVALRHIQALVNYRANKLETARDNLQEILKAAPDHLPSLLLSGEVNLRLGAYALAQNHLKQVLEQSPGSARARGLLAASQIKLNQLDAAQATLAPLRPEASSNPQLLALAGELSLKKQDYAKADKLLAKAAEIQPEDPTIRTLLGLSRLVQGDTQHALADLKSAATLDKDRDSADAMLIETLIHKGQFDQALNAIANLEKKQPNNPLPYNLRGAIHLAKKDLNNARKHFEHALAVKPDYFPAVYNLAHLDLRAKNPAAARQRFTALLQKDPKDTRAMMAMAEIAKRGGQENDYVSWLDKTAKSAPTMLPPRVLLIDYYLRKNKKDQALMLANETQTANQKNPATLELLARVQLATGDKEASLLSYERLNRMVPGLPETLIKLANVQMALNRPEEAKDSLNQALAIKPGYQAAQVARATLELRPGHYALAEVMARSLQQQYPDIVAGWVLEGDALAGQGKFAKAVGKYEAALRMGTSGPLLVKWHQALARTGKRGDSDLRLRKWVDEHPKDFATRLYLAQHAIQLGSPALAREHYAVLARQQPNDLSVLNNYALLLQQARDPRALEYAERAYKLHPDNTNVQDTLAGILVERGDIRRGLKLYEQALAGTRDDPAMVFHYAQALEKSGDFERARDALNLLLIRHSKFPQREEANALFTRLQAHRRP